jgi:hypothetical protein
MWRYSLCGRGHETCERIISMREAEVNSKSIHCI